MNYYPFHIGDYASATRHLTWDEDAAYRRLLDVYYTNERPFPNDMRQIFRLVMASTESQRDAVQIVLQEFFELTEWGWINHRADHEILAFKEKQEKARSSALVGVEKRALKNSEIRSDRIKAAKAKGTHTENEWNFLVSICGSKCLSCGSSGKLSKDHIVPIYQGGSDSIDNLQPLCKSCNSSKGPDSTDLRPDGWKQKLISCLTIADENLANAENKSANAEKDLANGQLPIPNISNSLRSLDKPARARSISKPDDVDENVWDGFLQIRKAKRAPISQAAIDGLRRQATKANLTLEDALRMCCERGWQGFNADWVQNARASPNRVQEASLDVAEKIFGGAKNGIVGKVVEFDAGTTVEGHATRVPEISHGAR